MAVKPFKGLLQPLLDETRPMDGMALSFDLPAEDEIATSGLSGKSSPKRLFASCRVGDV